MTANNLMKRVVYRGRIERAKTGAARSTFGLCSDPLTHFAVVFSALIHDTDHVEVSNFHAVKNQDGTTKVYRKRDMPLRSLDLAWDVLMESSYDNLRSCMYTSKDEQVRLRKFLLNAVVATDITDSELQSL